LKPGIGTEAAFEGLNLQRLGTLINLDLLWNPSCLEQRLKDKTALVSGAARGIGEAIARAFVAEGAFVYLTDTDDTAGTAVAATLGPLARYCRLDVRLEADWQRVTEQILAEHGVLHIVVHNAGITGLEDGNQVHDPGGSGRGHCIAVDSSIDGCRRCGVGGPASGW